MTRTPGHHESQPRLAIVAGVACAERLRGVVGYAVRAPTPGAASRPVYRAGPCPSTMPNSHICFTTNVDDLLTWLEDYPADQVDPTAMASVRRSLEWMIEQSPVEQGDRPASLRMATGLLIELMWWRTPVRTNRSTPSWR
jgi:hypothetical protein